MTEITAALSQFISEEILKQPGRQIDPEQTLISSGLINSFHLVDLALFVEDTFGVRIEDTELNADIFDTFDQLIRLIRQRQGQ